MEKEYCVYVHTNKANGKRYVGITSMLPEKRWANGHGYRSNVLFYRAIQKYGWESFKHSVLFDGLTREEAYAKEIELISTFKASNPRFGYNIDKGGNGSNRITEETRKKLSDGTRRYFKEHPEARKANADRLRNMPHNGENFIKYRKENPDCGKIHGEWLKSYYADHPEIVQASRAKCREYYNRHPEARIKKSAQTKHYFEGHPEAREHLAEIGRKQFSTDESKQAVSERMKKMFAEHPEKKTTKAVNQYSLDGKFIASFVSAREADKSTGISYKKISSVVTGKQKTAGGYIWRYSDELQDKAI